LTLFRPEDFILTSDAEHVLAKLKSEGKRAHVIAGGTGFYELARRGYIPEVKTVVSIMKLDLSYVNRETPGFIRIGATTSLQRLLESGIGDLSGIEALGDALREIRPVQVRNVATVGGEVCISVPIVDLPTALLACNATLTLMRAPGDKDLAIQEAEMNLEEFYIDAFLTKIKYGEIVKQVNIPFEQRSENKISSAFVKFGRTAYDFNLVNAAIHLSLDKDQKRLKSLRIFLGGIKRTPIRATELEKKLLGKVPEEKTIMEATREIFSKRVNLLPSVHGSSSYKKEILPVVIRDCLGKAYSRATR
jgi:CO/xanthine dehydrogenase FAD-binding subunit